MLNIVRDWAIPILTLATLLYAIRRILPWIHRCDQERLEWRRDANRRQLIDHLRSPEVREVLHELAEDPRPRSEGGG